MTTRKPATKKTPTKTTIIVSNDDDQYAIVRAPSVVEKLYLQLVAELKYWERLRKHHRLLRTAIANDHWFRNKDFSNDPMGAMIDQRLADLYSRLFANALLVPDDKLRKQAAKYAAQKYYDALQDTQRYFGHEVYFEDGELESDNESALENFQWDEDLTKAEVRAIIRKMGIDVPGSAKA